MAHTSHNLHYGMEKPEIVSTDDSIKRVALGCVWKINAIYFQCARDVIPSSMTYSVAELIHKNYGNNDPNPSDSQTDLLDKMSTYCTRTMTNTSESEEPAPVWDFYHSFFFSYTVVSTIGIN